ncbi:dTMP kinase [Pseudonocardiaceae bacterium YIM PH 21723]|nr:dTMP kinase [Pseudonocardiaceae bacterium YIM PH 21723]
MGRLIVIEGLDGAGKRTLTSRLIDAFTHKGMSVTQLAFPRYEQSVHAQLAQDALYGRLGDVIDSVHGMAMLFALDRRDAAEGIRDDLAKHDVVLLDRYVASNAAYSAARLGQDAGGEFVEWVRALEMDRFALPVPDLQIYLQVPTEVALQRARGREHAEARQRDRYESDTNLQELTGRVYEQLANKNWLSDWRVLDGVSTVDLDEIITSCC